MEFLIHLFVSNQARYHEAWTSLFRESVLYITELGRTNDHGCHSSSYGSQGSICDICVASLYALIGHLEGIDNLSTLRDTLRFPNTKYLTPFLKCCLGRDSCAFVTNVTKLCQDKIEKIPSFATFLGVEFTSR